MKPHCTFGTKGAKRPSKVGARVAIVALVACTIGVVGIGGVRAKQAIAKRDAFAVERESARVASGHKAPMSVTHPTATTWKPHIEVTGTLRPWREADVGFELGGRLTRLNVQAGDKVNAGAVVAVLDASRAGAQVSQAEAQVRASEANLALAEDTERRTAALVESRSIPRVSGRANTSAIGAGPRPARGRTRFGRARENGRRRSPPPALLRPGDPSADRGRWCRAARQRAHSHRGPVAFSLERHARAKTTRRSCGSGSSVTLRYRDRTVTGKVTTVVPSLDQATRRAPVEIEVPNDKSAPLLAWSFVHAVIDAGAEVPAVRVPVSARRPGSQDELFKVEGGKLVIARAPFIVDADGMWVIRGAVSATDTIVLSPSVEAKNGDEAGETALK